jgi:starch phosphorylase
MKVLVNGGVNLSERDGWWAEAYAPEAGWALGDGREHGDDPAVDAADADALYGLLEREVVPGYYTRGADGVPTAWVERIRQSMSRLTPTFSAERAVREYTENHYLPAAVAYRERAADKGAVAGEMDGWRRDLDLKWGALRFGPLRAETSADQRNFEVEVDLKDLDPNEIEVELYACGVDGTPSVTQEMKPAGPPDGRGQRRLYRATVSAARPERDYTARAVPRRAGVAVPLESGRILWAR